MTDSIPDKIQVGLELTLRQPADEPTHIMHLPVGGPFPIIVIAIDMDNYDDGQVDMQMDATGFKDPAMLCNVLQGVVEHMKTTAYDVMDINGVEHVDPIEPRKEGD
jgi:hypothetical protein